MSEPKGLSTDAKIGLALAGVALAALFVFIAVGGTSTPGPPPAEVERQVELARHSDLEKIKEILCTPTRERACMELETDTNGRVTPAEVFVDPALWTALPFSAREMAARWFSHCHLDDAAIVLRHGNTGKVLAEYDLNGGGYVGKE